MDDFVSYYESSNFASEPQTFVESHKFIENTLPHYCTKYIDLRHHFLREASEKV